MIREILFIHHSHTDVGYTHPQPVVLDLHRGFIDLALDLADRTQDYPTDARFRWTCEVTGITRDWWDHASNDSRDRFLAAVNRGQFEVAGMQWNMTPLMDHSMLLDGLKPVAFFRDLGIPVRAAMNTDVNGLPWGTVDALLDHGIEGVSMAINEHFGHALRPWPRAFRWQSPAGRQILAYNGMIYGVTSDYMLRIPHSIEEARPKVEMWMRHFAERGYPHSFLMMQITNLRYHDNAGPQAALPDFIRAYNAQAREAGGVTLRLSTPSEVFDRFRAEPAETLPVMRGDWTDWWNFGAGSTARETAFGMRGQRDLRAARAIVAMSGRAPTAHRQWLADQAQDKLALFAEHTWGADRSVRLPGSSETRTQQILKLTYPAEGAALARLVKRDAMQDLCQSGQGAEPMLLVANPHGFEVTQSLRIPALPPFAEPPTGPWKMGNDAVVPGNSQRHFLHRQDVLLSDLTDDRAFWTEPVTLPALSHRFIPASQVKPAGIEGLAGSTAHLSNGQVRLDFDTARGGLLRLESCGANRIAEFGENLRFGVPVLEEPDSEDRYDMFGQVDIENAEWGKAWRHNFPVSHTAARLISSGAAEVAQGSASLTQTFATDKGDRVEVTYRLLPGDPAVGLRVTLHKAPTGRPHAIYLPLPTALGRGWDCEFETAGAVVQLDAEQLPYSSRHYFTTLNFVRLADAADELVISCPDAPLWQVGGFGFGRFRVEDGTVDRTYPVALAWLTNNYWNTNFQGDQSGEMQFDFWIAAGPRRGRGQALQWATGRALPLPIQHCDLGLAGVAGAMPTGLQLDLGAALATGIHRSNDGEMVLTLLNPEEAPTPVSVRGKRAFGLGEGNLAGRVMRNHEPALEHALTLPARSWSTVILPAEVGNLRADASGTKGRAP